MAAFLNAGVRLGATSSSRHTAASRGLHAGKKIVVVV
jgi:hypothetical protein